jgi:MFS transporter, UMF1 family
MGSRIAFVAVGIWWLGFGYFALSRLPNGTAAATITTTQNVFAEGYKELLKVWQQLKKLKVLKRFLLAFFFYNTAVQTVMVVAALYGKNELLIPEANLIGTIVIIQLVAIIGANVISRLSAKYGNINTLIAVVLFWIIMCFAAYYAPVGSVNTFYLLGALIGFVMGGVQSLSRSTYAKFMPQTLDTASFFSFYDVTEKLGVVIGLLCYGLLTDFSGSQRNSVLALSVFFAIGAILLMYTAKALKTNTHATT